MDEEVKRRRKEREQQAVEQQAMEQRLAEEQKRKMEQNKHLLANLCSQKIMPNQSLIQSLTQNPILNQKLGQNFHQRTERISQLHRMQAQTQGALQQASQNIPMLPLQRNPSQTQPRTHNSWPNNATTTSTTNNGPLPNMVGLNSNLAQFYPPYLPLSLHQTMLSPSMSKNPLNEILDLTESSPSPSPDTTEGGLNLDRLARHTFDDDFNLESLISPNASNVQHAPQIQQPLLLQKQPLQATSQQNHNLLANNHQNLIDFFDPSPQVSTQKASPSSSTSSGSSSMSSLPSVNSLVSHVPSERLPAPTLTSTSSSSSSVISSTSSPSSLFSSSYFPSPCLPSQSGSQSSHLPSDHSTEALDVREVLNSMLQNGLDRQTVIQYWQQDWALKQQQLVWTDVSLGIWFWADCVLFAAVCDRTVGPTPSPLRAYSHVTACVRSPHPSLSPPVAFTCLKLSRRQRARPVSDFCVLRSERQL